MIYSKIIGTGSYLPEKVLTNRDLEAMVETSDDWIVERTGIKQRHIAASNETTTSMAAIAAERALATANLKATDIDLIIVATCSPNKFFPSCACQLQKILGTNNCMAFDLSAACTGFIYALTVADSMIKAGTVKNVLLVGSEVMSRTVDWDDRSTCILFGDGAGAVVLQASSEPGIISTHTYADGNYGDLLYLGVPQMAGEEQETPYMHMVGNKVFKFAVNHLEELVEIPLRAHNMEKSQIDWLVPHQANIRIIQATAKKLSLPMEKVICTIAEQGNTSAASIPLALDYGVRNNKIKPGQTILLEGFGGGITWGSALVKY